MLNILWFKDVMQKFKVTVDTLVENDLCVHMDSGRELLQFMEVDLGLYLFSNNKPQNN